MINVYILELISSKYYVGRSSNVNFRVTEHFKNKGSAWTTKYKPINILKIYENCDVYDEDKYTIKMMAKYGIENVRGGTFVRINLSVGEIEVITKMINNASDKCFNCYLSNHFITRCPYDKIKNKEMILLRDRIIEFCKKYDDNYISITNLKNVLCDVDSVIFNGITENDVCKWCDIINDLNIKGINYLDVDIVNYIDFSIGIATVLDRKFYKKSGVERE